MAKIQKVQASPTASTKSLKNRVTKKLTNQQKAAVRVDAIALILGGYISPLTAHGIGPKP